MQFGIYVTHQLPRPWAEGSERDLFEQGLTQVALADQLGIDHAWVAEQHFTEEYSHSSAPEVFLAAASQRTTRIRLGHGVVLTPPPYNHPARVAERVATLDLISGGRVDLGSGDSKSRVELEGFGVPPTERRAMSLEALAQIADMMALDPFPGAEGQFTQMPARSVIPKPLQRPHPPLWIACSDDATIRLAARLGLGALVHAFLDPDEARRMVADYYSIFREECVPLGHAVNPNVAMLNPFYCHPDGGTARDVGADAHGFFTFAVRHYYSFGQHVPGRSDLWADYVQVRQEMGGPPPVRGSHAFGTPAELIDHVRAYEDAGVDQIILAHQAGALTHEQISDSLRLFGRDVLPAFARERDQRARVKDEALAPFVRAAMNRKPRNSEADDVPVPPVPAYGLSRPDVDPETAPEPHRDMLRGLQRMKDIVRRRNG